MVKTRWQSCRNRQDYRKLRKVNVDEKQVAKSTTNPIIKAKRGNMTYQSQPICNKNQQIQNLKNEVITLKRRFQEVQDKESSTNKQLCEKCVPSIDSTITNKQTNNSIPVSNQVTTINHCNAKSPSTLQDVSWECLTDKGWTPYDINTSQKIEKAYNANDHTSQKDKAEVSFFHQEISYKVSFKDMQQKRQDQVYSARPIRRVIYNHNIHTYHTNPWSVCTNAAYILNDESNGVRMREIDRAHLPSKLSRETYEFNTACGHYYNNLFYTTGNQPYSSPAFTTSAGITTATIASTKVIRKVCVIEYESCHPVSINFEKTRQRFIKENKPFVEEWVFHGTVPAAVTDIVQQGFKVGGIDVPTRHGSSYGTGIYTALGPATPMNLTHIRDGAGPLIIAKCISGRYQQSSDTHLECDSWGVSDVLVLRDGTQLLPQYVLYFSSN